MTNNLIQFPESRQCSEPRVKMLESSEELKALRAAFDRACIDWPIELPELPENNKMYCSSKK